MWEKNLEWKSFQVYSSNEALSSRWNCLNCSGSSQSSSLRGGHWGYQNPKTRKKIGTNPKTQMSLVSKTVFKSLNIDILCQVENPKTRTFSLQHPKPGLGKWQNPLPVEYAWPENPHDFLEKPQNPRPKAAKPATREIPKPPSFYDICKCSLRLATWNPRFYPRLTIGRPRTSFSPSQ